jgi:hypothetical protein
MREPRSFPSSLRLRALLSSFYPSFSFSFSFSFYPSSPGWLVKESLRSSDGGHRVLISYPERRLFSLLCVCVSHPLPFPPLYTLYNSKGGIHQCHVITSHDSHSPPSHCAHTLCTHTTISSACLFSRSSFQSFVLSLCLSLSLSLSLSLLHTHTHTHTHTHWRSDRDEMVVIPTLC